MATGEKEPWPGARTHVLRSNVEFQPREPPVWPWFFISNCRVCSHGHPLKAIGRINNNLRPLEDTIRHRFAQAVTGCPEYNESKRQVFSHPARIGSPNIYIPQELAKGKYANSYSVTTGADYHWSEENWNGQVYRGSDEKPSETKPSTPWSQQLILQMRRVLPVGLFCQLLSLCSFCTKELSRMLLLSRTRGICSTCQEHVSLCVYRKTLTVEHAFTCPMGWMTTVRHNEVRDLTADLMSEVCQNVCTKPELQPLPGEILHGRLAICQNGARVDIRGEGIREKSQDAFLTWVILTHSH